MNRGAMQVFRHDTLAILATPVAPRSLNTSSAANKPLVLDTLLAVRVLHDSTAFALPSRLQIVGRYLVVADHLTSPHITVVDVQANRIVGRCAEHGRDNDQLLDPAALFRTAGDSAGIWTFDYRSSRAAYISFVSEIPGHCSLTHVMQELPGLPRDVDQIFWTHQGYFASGPFTDDALVVVDTIRRSVRHIRWSMPFDSANLPDPDGRSVANARTLARSPDGQTFVAAYSHSSRLDILDDTGRLIRTVIGPRKIATDFYLTNQAAGRHFHWRTATEYSYVDISLSQRRIFALYCGCSMASNRHASLVHVFTYDGRLVRELALDREVVRITVDTEGQYLYGGDGTPNRGQIVQWRLPPISDSSAQ